MEAKCHKLEVTSGMHKIFMYPLMQWQKEEEERKKRYEEQANAEKAKREAFAATITGSEFYLMLKEIFETATFWGENGSAQFTIERKRYREIKQRIEELENASQT